MSFYIIDDESSLSRVEQLVAKDKDGTKQMEAVSDCSHGYVADDELLARSLDYPNKYTAEGGLNEELFQDAFTHGASAQRLIGGWESNASDVHARFEARAKSKRDGENGRGPSPDNLYIGAFHMTAAELRECRVQGDTTPRIRVYDAAETQNHLHAEILIDTTGLKKHQRKELRVRLMTLAQQRGLYVSPYLSEENQKLAERTQCTLHN